MRVRQSLRQRVTLAILATVILFCGSFAGLIAFINIRLEDDFLYSGMARELNEYRKAYRVDAAMAPPATATLDSYLVNAADSQKLPMPLRGLPPGQYHEMAIGGRTYHVGVAAVDDKMLFLAQDITSIERWESLLNWLLVIVFCLATVAAILVGYWTARIVIAPVNRLARRVHTLPPEQRNIVLAREFSDYEVAVIARAFDSYTARLDAFIARERSFTEDASHELRTPLTVLQNALELLDRNEQRPNGEARAIARMHRTLARMNNLVNALLFLARDPTAEDVSAQANLGDVVAEVMGGHRSMFAENGLIPEPDISNPGVVAAPEAAVAIVVGNLLRNAIEHGGAGKIRVAVKGLELRVQDDGPGMPAAQKELFARGHVGPGSRGSGIGLYLVRRVCDRYRWRVNVISEPGQGSVFIVAFADRSPPVR